MTASKKNIKTLKDAVNYYINGHQPEIEVTDKQITITMHLVNEQMADSKSLQGLLEWMQKEGLVIQEVQSIWTGMQNGKFIVWCIR